MERQQAQQAMSGIASGRPRQIDGSHLDRLAVVYVRQSTLRQVHQHQESGRLQYALQDTAIAWGWSPPRVLVIDEDQGCSGASAEQRSGFQRLVAEVGLNHVGLVLGIEMSRLARSNSDWYRLLDMCALSHTLIADTDGLYDPRQYNDRLLLGLKGTMSEAELHILRQRLDAGRWAKARRGELYIKVPMGYVYRPSGEIIKDPDEQVQSVIELVFATFERCRTINGVARALLKSGVHLPVRERSGPDQGSLRWSRPSVRTLRKLFASPIYAGAYVYGKKSPRVSASCYDKDGALAVERLEDRWEVCLKDRLPVYISWEEFARNVRQIQANHPKRRGTPRRGASLLAGLVACGHCGKRMGVRYSQNGNGLRYCCEPGRPLPQDTPCHSVPGTLIDEAVSRLVIEVLEPMAIELSLHAAADLEAERAQILAHWTKRLERAHYEVTRAFRQYNAVEPENRLVARQLEQQWEAALQAEADLRAEYERIAAAEPVPLSEHDRETIRQVAQDIPALWHAPSTRAADRQALVRQLVAQVVVTLKGNTEQMQVEVQWAAGGNRTNLSLIRPVGSLQQLSYYPELLQRTMTLRKTGHDVKTIARRLTEEGWHPLQGTWTVAKVTRLLDQPEATSLKQSRTPISQGVPKAAHEWTTRELAEELGMARDSLHNWVQKGAVRGRKVTYRGRSLWLLWADESELERLREMRDFPHYGTRPPRIEQEDQAHIEQTQKKNE